MHMVAFSQPRRISCSPVEVLDLHTLMGYGDSRRPSFFLARLSIRLLGLFRRD